MFQFHARVLEDASNQPNASTAYNLSGTAETGHRSFASVMTTLFDCVVLAEQVDGDGNPGGAWEIAECTYTDAAPDTLTRDKLLDSSTGSLIDWSAIAVPRLSIVDRPGGMSRVIGSWDHGGADVATIDFEFAPKAGMRYEVIGSYISVDGNVTNVNVMMVFKIGGAWITGTSYLQAKLGRSYNGWFLGAFSGAAGLEVNLGDNIYGTGHANYEVGEDEINFVATVLQSAESTYTRVLCSADSGFSNVATSATTGGWSGGITDTGVIQGVRFSNNQTNFRSGNITITEIGAL